MKIKTKYNIGDKVAIKRDGKMSVMTIDKINITKIAGRPIGISYSGTEVVEQRVEVVEGTIDSLIG